MTSPELPKKWTPTHQMTHHVDGRTVDVMLVPSSICIPGTPRKSRQRDGAAFTRGDWGVRRSSRMFSSYKFLGQWFYRNEPFKGTVVPL